MIDIMELMKQIAMKDMEIALLRADNKYLQMRLKKEMEGKTHA